MKNLLEFQMALFFAQVKVHGPNNIKMCFISEDCLLISHWFLKGSLDGFEAVLLSVEILH